MRWMILVILWATLFSSECFPGPLVSSNGKIIRWNISADSPTLNYFISSNIPSSIAEWARSGFSKWEAVDSSYVSFTEVSGESSAQIKVIVTQSNPLVPAVASYHFNSQGFMEECFVLVGSDAATKGYPSQYLESVIVHEIGHCLGLHHSFMSDAVMSYRASSPTDLALDDRFHLTLLYPSDGNSSYPMGCATIQFPISKRSVGPRKNQIIGNGIICLALCLIYFAIRFRIKNPPQIY